MGRQALRLRSKTRRRPPLQLQGDDKEARGGEVSPVLKLVFKVIMRSAAVGLSAMVLFSMFNIPDGSVLDPQKACAVLLVALCWAMAGI